MTRALSSRLRLSGPRFSCTPVEHVDNEDEDESSEVEEYPDDVFNHNDVTTETVTAILDTITNNETKRLKLGSNGDNSTNGVSKDDEKLSGKIANSAHQPNGSTLPPWGSYPLPTIRQTLPKKCSLAFKRLPTKSYDFKDLYENHEMDLYPSPDTMSLSLQKKLDGLPIWKVFKHVEPKVKGFLPSISVITEEKSYDAFSAASKSDTGNKLISLVSSLPQVKAAASRFFKQKRKRFLVVKEDNSGDQDTSPLPAARGKSAFVLPRRATALEISYPVKKPNYEDLVLPEISHQPDFLKYAAENLAQEK